MEDRKELLITISMDPALFATLKRYSAALGIELDELITNAVAIHLRCLDKMSEILADAISKLKEDE